jgi:hypothetical protein
VRACFFNRGGVLGFGFRVSGFGLRISDFGFRVSGFESRVPRFGIGVSGIGFQDLGFGRGADLVEGVDMPDAMQHTLPRVWGLGLRV